MFLQQLNATVCHMWPAVVTRE